MWSARKPLSCRSFHVLRSPSRVATPLLTVTLILSRTHQVVQSPLRRGERYVSAEITQRLVPQALGNRSESAEPIDLLTDRELEVFRMIGSGKTSGQIAGELSLSTHTVDTHRENIKRKLGVKNAAELSCRAVQFFIENM